MKKEETKKSERRAPSDIKELFRENYIHYASYVILDRAIPEITDGLKPVQRRILWTLYEMDDSKFHKVANAAGQTMALHPHGDAPIVDAIVNLANKNYLLDRQGNFGNPLTNDPAAAARYIETRLSLLAKETLFNPELTEVTPSYDGRKNEPVVLPAKIPLLLMQGAEGIAVGMATRILPHNFKELLEAEIAYLEKKPFELTPDFPSGGLMDPADYQKGSGSVRHRATIESKDEKTLVIREIAYGTTTESVIRSVDEAAKKGKIKIDSIHDYTAEKVEIEIKLPRGQYASEIIPLLFAHTDCEVVLHSQVIAIRDNMPWEGTVEEILIYHVEQLVSILKRELELEEHHLREKIFGRTLERIFIENRLYKQIENVSTLEKIDTTLERALEPYYIELARVPKKEDRAWLLELPIRKISRFDIDKNRSDIAELEKRLKQCEKELKNVRGYTLKYLKGLLEKHGKYYPRKTAIEKFPEIARVAAKPVKLKIAFDEVKGMLGSRVSAKTSLECSSKDKILLFYRDGSYKVIAIPERSYVGGPSGMPVWIGLADRKTAISVLYSDSKGVIYAKRFIVKQFTLNKSYRFLDEGAELHFISEAESPELAIYFKSKPKDKIKSLALNYTDVAVKKVAARGTRVEKRPIDRVVRITEEAENES